MYDNFSDRYAEDLLRRLTLNTPSFRDYSKKAPLNVLDLGCGEGRWVLETAATWGVHGTTVTGFDLMDVLCDAWEDAPHNARFVRGNLCVCPAVQLIWCSRSYSA
jgi:ubiquinone/menaquinone biosynthesis C-methylase UbiE